MFQYLNVSFGLIPDGFFFALQEKFPEVFRILDKGGDGK